MLRAYLQSMFGSTARIDRSWIRDVRERLRPVHNPIIFDVGAHAGSIATTLCRGTSAATVYAIEAAPLAFEMLQSRCRRYPNITPLNLAISNTNAQVFISNAAAAQTNRVFSPGEHASHSGSESRVAVPCQTLDSLMDYLACPRIDFLKIDTEGHELQVLEGARRALEASSIDLMLIECTFNRRSAPHTDVLDVLSVLRLYRYEVIQCYNYGIGRFIRGIAYSNLLFGRRRCTKSS